jgi:hypothetical protein
MGAPFLDMATSGAGGGGAAFAAAGSAAAAAAAAAKPRRDAGSAAAASRRCDAIDFAGSQLPRRGASAAVEAQQANATTRRHLCLVHGIIVLGSRSAACCDWLSCATR